MSANYIGVDIGTSSSKGVLVSDGTVVASATREHSVQRPHPQHVEMDARVWWDEFVSITRELVAISPVPVEAVGVSGMGPCVAVADGNGSPLRPAILYGIDTRAVEQIATLNRELGQGAIVETCGSALSTQSAGPKLLWISENEPEIAARTRTFFMPSSWLVWHLTGEYVLDHHSASQCTPLYDTRSLTWIEPRVERVLPGLRLPALCWPGEIAGTVTGDAARETGLPEGTPVIAGTIDAWTEAVSVGAHHPGDLMLMYGTTMFLVNTTAERVTSDVLWGTVGAFPGSYSLAAGMATSGAITGWSRELFGSPPFETLLNEADAAGPGSNGLLMLPYFSGERSPLSDPDARGTIAGLTVSTTRGDLYRASLEATALGVRHNLQALAATGGEVTRAIAVGGGTQGDLWTQIVSDVTGLEQLLPTVTIGASFGAAMLAAQATEGADIDAWNPPQRVVTPREELGTFYNELFRLYRGLYDQTRDVTHELVALRSIKANFDNAPFG
ncbi:MAG: xylulokinase [Microbacteriaceae bacterium]|nr:xylulokinase [Microbacteriaceae bacterium]